MARLRGSMDLEAVTTTPRDAKFISITDIALLITLPVLSFIGQKYGWVNLAVWHGVPYFYVVYVPCLLLA